MRKIVLILIFSLVLGCIGEENTDKIPEIPIAWVDDVEQAKEMAENEDKLLFIYFTAKTCPACRQMEKKTYRDEDVIILINENFVPVYFDLDAEANKEIYDADYDQYVEKKIPTVLIFDCERKLLYKIVGYHSDNNKFIEVLNQALKLK